MPTEDNAYTTHFIEHGEVEVEFEIRPLATMSSVLDSTRCSMYYEGRNVNKKTVKNPLVNDAILPVRYGSAMFAESLRK